MQGDTGARWERSEYLDRMDGLLFGDDPRRGFLQGARFVHPALAFDVTLPAPWKSQIGLDSVVAVSPDERATPMVGLSSETNAVEAAAAFFGRKEVTRRDAEPVKLRLPGTASGFSVGSGRSTVRGLVAFAQRGGAVVVVAGLGPARDRGGKLGAVEETMASLARVTDPDTLATQPMRLRVVVAEEGSTLRQLSLKNPSPVELSQLATLNGVAVDARLRQGQRIKLVVVAGPPNTHAGRPARARLAKSTP
ncbi:MAG: hypothetical protein JKY37_03045 [Nannocystaceae bacterium]|nr:hypothetical protein [Nannocystaceae bacterium]